MVSMRFMGVCSKVVARVAALRAALAARISAFVHANIGAQAWVETGFEDIQDDMAATLTGPTKKEESCSDLKKKRKPRPASEPRLPGSASTIAQRRVNVLLRHARAPLVSKQLDEFSAPLSGKKSVRLLRITSGE